MKIYSDAFQNHGCIPVKYTDYGENKSPGFQIEEIPDGTVTMAIVMDDLDIPLIKAYNHWLLFNLPRTNEIPENLSALLHQREWMERQGKQYAGTMQGIAYGKHRYRGPRPPFFIRGRHRYAYHIYALDTKIQADENINKDQFLQLAEGHILAAQQVTGTYQNVKNRTNK